MLFFIFLAISLVTAPSADAARGKDETNPGQLVNSVNVAMLAPVHPVHPMPNVVRPAEIGEVRNMLNQLALRANIPVIDINAPPVARDLALPPVPPIDRSPNYEEKWKGDLTWANLTSQRQGTKLLRNQGNRLQYELYELSPNHNLLNHQTRITLSGFRIRTTIRANKSRYFALQSTQPTLAQYRDLGFQYRDPIGY